MDHDGGRTRACIRSRAHLAGLAVGMALAGAVTAQAGDKKYTPPPPHAAPSGGSGGAHFPGTMGGAPHMGGGGGAHIPGSMGGGVHIPGSMGGGAHIPGSMGGGAHVLGSMARGEGQARGGEGAREAGGEPHGHTEAHRAQPRSAQHQSATARSTHAEPSREAHAGEAGGQHRDPRIGGKAALHTRLAAGAAIGVGAGVALHHVGAGGREGGGRDFRARPADRDVGRDRAFASAHAHDFHARFVRDFSPAEFGRWRGGAWSAGWHFGRFGWWWDVGGVWYPYAEPIYPFPLEVSAITVYGDDYLEIPLAAPVPAIAPLPAAPAALYSCASPAGYFPAVPACSQPWQIADAPPP